MKQRMFHIFFNTFVYIFFFNYIYRTAEEGSKVKIIMDAIINRTKQISAIAYQNLKPVVESFVEASNKYHLAMTGLEYDDEDLDEDLDNTSTQTPEHIEPKPEIKYEDKYLNEFNKLEKTLLSKEKLDSLKNSIVMETTPLGNAIMFYDNTRETFTFYSDNIIPYRYLETVARKYVIMTNSKEIYVDMSKEIETAENIIKDKLKQKQAQLDALTLEQAQLEQQITQPQTQNNKKELFAKLKSYNRETVSNPKAQKNANKTSISISKENIVLKERANRYSYEGKLVNFSFLKKVDKKLTDKRYGMSFADFKKSLSQSLSQTQTQTQTETQ
jgi:hypothetical protein